MEKNRESRSGEISLHYSESSNLLEQSGYKYQLQERSTPNLYRYLFDYDSVPKVSFNHRHVPINMPDRIWITDTTFRDGQQSTSPFTVKQIVGSTLKDGGDAPAPAPEATKTICRS